MIHPSEFMSLDPVPTPCPRGVHSYVERSSGEIVYYKSTSDGRREIRRRLPDETEAALVREMWRELNQEDPVTAPPHLALYVDGVRRR